MSAYQQRGELKTPTFYRAECRQEIPSVRPPKNLLVSASNFPQSRLPELKFWKPSWLESASI